MKPDAIYIYCEACRNHVEQIQSGQLCLDSLICLSGLCGYVCALTIRGAPRGLQARLRSTQTHVLACRELR